MPRIVRTLRVVRRTGEVFLVFYDDEDSESVAAHAWHINESGRSPRAVTNRRPPGRAHGHHDVLTMAQILTGQKDIDHANRNPLDNRRSNLRSATRTQQVANRRPTRTGTSQFKGVCKPTGSDRWVAHCTVPGRASRHLGRFDSEEEAALAYDRAAFAAYGEFAYLNFPDRVTPAITREAIP